jgi:hypothetical protein
MKTGQSMDATVLMKKLVERKINTKLLIEFYEEVAENERVFSRMVEEISSDKEIEEREKCLDHIEHFCVLLRELQIQYGAMLGGERIFVSEIAKRESMINNASRFIDFLEKECNLEFPY